MRGKRKYKTIPIVNAIVFGSEAVLPASLDANPGDRSVGLCHFRTEDAITNVGYQCRGSGKILLHSCEFLDQARQDIIGKMLICRP